MDDPPYLYADARTWWDAGWAVTVRVRTCTAGGRGWRVAEWGGATWPSPVLVVAWEPTLGIVGTIQGGGGGGGNMSGKGNKPGKYIPASTLHYVEDCPGWVTRRPDDASPWFWQQGPVYDVWRAAGVHRPTSGAKLALEGLPRAITADIVPTLDPTIPRLLRWAMPPSGEHDAWAPRTEGLLPLAHLDYTRSPVRASRAMLNEAGDPHFGGRTGVVGYSTATTARRTLAENPRNGMTLRALGTAGLGGGTTPSSPYLWGDDDNRTTLEELLRIEARVGHRALPAWMGIHPRYAHERHGKLHNAHITLSEWLGDLVYRARAGMPLPGAACMWEFALLWQRWTGYGLLLPPSSPSLSSPDNSTPLVCLHPERHDIGGMEAHWRAWRARTLEGRARPPWWAVVHRLDLPPGWISWRAPEAPLALAGQHPTDDAVPGMCLVAGADLWAPIWMRMEAAYAHLLRIATWRRPGTELHIVGLPPLDGPLQHKLFHRYIAKRQGEACKRRRQGGGGGGSGGVGGGGVGGGGGGAHARGGASSSSLPMLQSGRIDVPGALRRGEFPPCMALKFHAALTNTDNHMRYDHRLEVACNLQGAGLAPSDIEDMFRTMGNRDWKMGTLTRIKACDGAMLSSGSCPFAAEEEGAGGNAAATSTRLQAYLDTQVHVKEGLFKRGTGPLALTIDQYKLLVHGRIPSLGGKKEGVAQLPSATTSRAGPRFRCSVLLGEKPPTSADPTAPALIVTHPAGSPSMWMRRRQAVLVQQDGGGGGTGVRVGANTSTARDDSSSSSSSSEELD